MGNRDDQIDSYHKRSISMASCSKSICETINGSHTYVIQGYSLSKGMGPGRYLTSDTFNVGGYDWAIYFFPDGKNPEDNSLYVSVFIALASEGNDVRALFELTLRDQSGNNKHKVHSHFNRALESGPYSLKYRGSMWGYKRFFRRSLLESSEYLKDDCLELHCTVGIVRNRVEGPKLYRISVPPSDMGQSFKELLDDELGCDVAFHIGEETFKAHKLIIAARSPVFRAQFSGLVRLPNLDEVVLEDVEPSIFKAMLQFIYSDNLPDVQEIMRTTTSSSLEIVMQHLLAAADRFGLDRLKLLCEAKLCSEIAVETVAATLSLAEKHQCHQLKSICLKFATAKLGEVMETEGFKQLEVNCPSLIPELLDTVVLVDENPGPLSRKRSGSSIFGLDLAPDGAPAQPSDPNDGRRIRGRL